MKRLILQVNVKLENTDKNFKRFEPVEDLYRLSESQAKLFAERWGADYHQITDCDFLPDKHPTFQRFKMYEMNYDQILYLDMDAVILNPCPNIFEEFKDHSFSAINNFEWSRGGVKFDTIRAQMNEIYGASSDYRPFCAGIMLIRKDFLDNTRHLWRNHLYSYDERGEYDQGIMNKLVVDLGGHYNELDKKWGAWFTVGRYIDHLGGPIRKKQFKLSRYLKRHNLCQN